MRMLHTHFRCRTAGTCSASWSAGDDYLESESHHPDWGNYYAPGSGCRNHDDLVASRSLSSARGGRSANFRRPASNGVYCASSLHL